MNTLSDQEIRQKITDLDSVPVPNWNPQTTWGKVEQQVNTPPWWKKPGLIWSAAIAVVLVLGLSAFWLTSSPAPTYALQAPPTLNSWIEEQAPIELVEIREYVTVTTPSGNSQDAPKINSGGLAAEDNAWKTVISPSNAQTLDSVIYGAVISKENSLEHHLSNPREEAVISTDPEETSKNPESPSFVWTTPIPGFETRSTTNSQTSSTENFNFQDSTIKVATVAVPATEAPVDPSFVWVGNAIPGFINATTVVTPPATPSPSQYAQSSQKANRSNRRRSSASRRLRMNGNRDQLSKSTSDSETLAFRTKL
ncbi:MAG: hypothetical protein ACFB10_00165 [Salibacteraceae bacterium]